MNIDVDQKKYVNENEINETIKNLNVNEKFSIEFKNIKISLKRIGEKLIIEPYCNNTVNSIFKILGFFLAVFILSGTLVMITDLLDYMKVGDRTYSDGYATKVSWHGVYMYSSRELYTIASYFLGRLLRKKVLNKLLVLKYYKDWKEFKSKYSEFKY